MFRVLGFRVVAFRFQEDSGFRVYGFGIMLQGLGSLFGAHCFRSTPSGPLRRADALEQDIFLGLTPWLVVLASFHGSLPLSQVKP